MRLLRNIKNRIIVLTLTLVCALGAGAGMPQIANASEKADGWPIAPDTVAEANILINADSGAILSEKNAYQKMYPASITKIVTALVAMENCTLDEMVTFSEKAVTLEEDDATLGFLAGEQISMEDCLYGLLLYSANECANAIAEHVAGSKEAFTTLMNDFAARCGATNTHFSNPSGLFDKNHYTCCYDMALIGKVAVKNSSFMKIDGSTSHTIDATNKSAEPKTFYHRHKMLFTTNEDYYEDVTGGKTGYLDEAGRTLVTFANRDENTLISVVMKSTTEEVYKDTASLLDYGFNNFYSLNVAENETKFSSSGSNVLGNYNLARIDTVSMVTLPSQASFSELRMEYITEESKDYFASLNYYYGEHYVGKAHLYIAKSTTESIYSPIMPIEEPTLGISFAQALFINLKIVIIILAVVAAVIIIIFVARAFSADIHIASIDMSSAHKRMDRIKNRKYRNKSRKKLF